MDIFKAINNGINNLSNSLNANRKAEKQYSKEAEEDIRVILEREKTKRYELTITAIMTIGLVLLALLMMCVVANTKQ